MFTILLVYAGYVNSSGGGDDFTETCPTCRSIFYTVTPDLTYLPKKYHPYVIPAVRRVYIDGSAISSLQRKLARAETRVKKLESDQEILLKRCEAYMAASHAHASSESNALIEVERLKRKVANLSTYMEATDTQQNELEKSVDQVKDEVAYWKSKYSWMKERLQSIDTQNGDDIDNDHKRKGKKSTKPHGDGMSRDASTSNDIVLETPTRQIKPIPRRPTRATTAQSIERPKRHRISYSNTTI
ncbi:hypothetical protein APHAL10511_003964 [Amanita phalloides]|nr:hypothetical protein APHAL10511_003964 [Amanita phalloides]